mmetsp:Transcript_96416/g.251297  ORF Transcript_96416/g.251297 Transcript_96416/m.251297 type:complete len:226 (-) Transcript_96416:7-684(-)
MAEPGEGSRHLAAEAKNFASACLWSTSTLSGSASVLRSLGKCHTILWKALRNSRTMWSLVGSTPTRVVPSNCSSISFRLSALSGCLSSSLSSLSAAAAYTPAPLPSARQSAREKEKFRSPRRITWSLGWYSSLCAFSRFACARACFLFCLGRAGPGAAASGAASPAAASATPSERFRLPLWPSCFLPLPPFALFAEAFSFVFAATAFLRPLRALCAMAGAADQSP